MECDHGYDLAIRSGGFTAVSATCCGANDMDGNKDIPFQDNYVLIVEVKIVKAY
jgi:hypothetical protein